MKKWTAPPRTDYRVHGEKRRVLTNYLRTGPFRQVGGSMIFGRSVRRRRIVLCAAALLFLILGLVSVF